MARTAPPKLAFTNGSIRYDRVLPERTRCTDIRSGIAELEKVLGPIPRHKTLEELNHPETTSQKLQQLRSIMKAAGAHEFMENLDPFFIPLTEESHA